MSTFHMFLDLPKELRLLIWEYSIQPRIVAPLSWRDVTICDDDDDRGRFCVVRRRSNVLSRTPTPSILYVCRESRYIGEKHYRKSFLCQGYRHPNPSSLPCDFVWLNFDIDTVQLSVDNILDQYPADPENHLIQRLQVTCNDVEMNSFPFSRPRLGSFSALKSVDFMFDSPYDLDCGWYTFLAGPEEADNWGCDPAIVRVIHQRTGEVLDYERDMELVAFDVDPLQCPGTCVHVGPHNWDWLTNDGTWYTTAFGESGHLWQ